MIVWSGKGFLSVLVLLVCFALLVSVIPKEQGDYAFVVALFAAGAFSWFMGKKWNEGEARTMVDKETGQEVVYKPNHSLFWINMEYWGPIFGVLGLVILAQQFIK